MKYEYTIIKEINNYSIEDLINLEKFIVGLFKENAVRFSDARIACGQISDTKSTVEAFFKNNQIVNNFSKLEHMQAFYVAKNDNIDVTLYKNISHTKLQVHISFEDEITALGLKSCVEDYLQKTFEEIETTSSASNVSLDAKTSTSLSCNPLQYNIQCATLTLEDFKDIETLLKQDLIKTKTFEIIVEPNDELVKRKPNALSYKFQDIQTMLSNKEICSNIKMYNITFKLNNEDIDAKLVLEQVFFNNFSRIWVYGKNQTLCYGKFLLLREFLKYRNRWFGFIYSNSLLPIIVMIFSFVVVLFVIATIWSLYKQTFNWRTFLICIFSIFLSVSFFRAYPKIKIITNSDELWIKKTVNQFYINAVLEIIAILVALYK